MSKHKQVPAEVKAGDEGHFSALAAVFDVVDRVGDRMMYGSFTETLRRWRESGKRIPIVWSHKTDDPNAVIGSADPNDVRETTRGLQVDGRLDIDSSSTARRVYDLLKSNAVGGWSFGYVVKKQRQRNGANEVSEVELLEVGPTVSPAHPMTATLAVKSAEAESDVAAVKSAAELRAELETLSKGVDLRPPAQVRRFEC